MQAFTLDLESKNPKNKRKPSHNKTACLLCQAQRRKWLPAGTSVIPKCNKKQKTQPDEPSIRAVKVIICAFTASPNLFEVCLSNRHCTNPLVHQGQQLAAQRCSCLCWDPSVFPTPAWKWYLQETKDWASAVCWARSFMRTVRVLPSVQRGRTKSGLLSSQKELWSSSSAPPLSFPLPLPFWRAARALAQVLCKYCICIPCYQSLMEESTKGTMALWSAAEKENFGSAISSFPSPALSVRATLYKPLCHYKEMLKQ